MFAKSGEATANTLLYVILTICAVFVIGAAVYYILRNSSFI
jgi:hypothetical protein